MEQSGPGSAIPVSEYLETEPPKWPLVLGILSILWGGVGVVSGIAGSVSLINDARGSKPDVTNSPLAIVFAALGTLMALALLVGGVQLLRRRAMAIGLLKAWVVLSLVVQVGSSAFMIRNRDAFEEALREKIQMQMDEQAAKTGGKAVALPAGFEKMMLLGGMACGGALGLGAAGLVAFFVFGRRGREAEQTWKRAAA
jgi:uncharacterized membrane protein YhaH (DUF805 family)